MAKLADVVERAGQAQPGSGKSRALAARALLRDLRDLREVRAPRALRATVSAQTGSAPDEFFALPTPLGAVWVACSAEGISAVGQEASAAEFAEYVRHARGRLARETAAPPARLVASLERHLAGTPATPLRFDLRGLAPFECAVLRKALEIPRGEVRPYHWIAREIERPRAVRAVGTALARNPIPLFIPCHRVVRGDGHIGNYGLGGRSAKQLILAVEGVDSDRLERLARAGVRYLASDSTGIFCYPTCRHARRVTKPHLLNFRSADAALDAGYRP
ncbi:MAG: methylated-DNA--[protein]-cysteine S-methyltransferase, partial [Chloroflexota bacterium]